MVYFFADQQALYNYLADFNIDRCILSTLIIFNEL